MSKIRESDTPKDAIILLVERRGSMWHPVIERHEGCYGGRIHDACKVVTRAVAVGFHSKADAETAIAQWEEENKELLE